MAYLGRGIENLSDRVVLDSLTASATASYTLQLNSVNFVPSSAESLTVSLNGVIQAPISSYTVSGSTLTFASALTSSDSIDFIIAERGITLQTPSAGSVGTSQLASSAVTNAKIASDAAIATTKLGTGAVMQVVYAENRTNTFTTNSTSAVDVTFDSTVFTASITPSSTSSKILCMGIVPMRCAWNGSYDARMGFAVFAKIGSGSYTELYGDPNNASYLGGYDYGASGMQFGTIVPVNLVYSPSTTSAVTFKYQVRTNNSSAEVVVNRQAIGTSFTLMEIAG